MSASFPDNAPGYRNRRYAEALGMAVRLQRLPACGGHLLVRRIGQGSRFDACGAYPVFSCSEPDRLVDDIASLDDSFVTVTLVADPLAMWNPERLRQAFPVMRPLGAHFVIDLGTPGFVPGRHHRRALRKAAAYNSEIRVEADPAALSSAWTDLYAVLIEQVGITGLRRFSGPIFEKMLAVPGTVLFTAWDRDALLGADWYFEDGDRVYAHMSAYSHAGYARAVSYPMLDAALRHFRQRGARLLDLGGVPMVEGGGTGLAQFKEGWSTRTLPAWLCGRVLDEAEYTRLSAPAAASDYFPGYRRGEFG